MQTRDRIITILGGAGVIAALMLLSRCGSENTTDAPGTALPSTAATNQRTFGSNTPGPNRPGSYSGPSLEQLIQDGTRRRVERFSAGGPAEAQGDGQAASQAMFEGERVAPRIEGPGSPNARPPRRFNRPTTPPSVPSSPSQQFGPGQGQVNQLLQQAAAEPIPPGFQSAGSSNDSGTRSASTSSPSDAVSDTTAQPSGSSGTDTTGGTSGSGRNPFIVGGIDLSGFFADTPFPIVGGGNGSGTGTGGGSGTGTDTTNRPPTIASLGVSPSVVNAPGPIVLTANGATDPDSATGGRVVRVQFYRDSNNNNTFDPSTDELLATDSTSADGFGALVTAQASWQPAGGPVRLFARAQDDANAFSNVATTLVTLNRAPTLASLSAAPAVVAPGATITLVATGAADPDPPGAALASVQFFFDADNDGAVTDADSLVATVNTAGGTVEASISAPTGASGTLRYLARPRDQTGTLGTPVSASVTINRAPVISALTSSPSPRVLAPLTLTATADDADLPPDAVISVAFYIDSDANGTLNTMTDERIAVDTTPSDGYTATVVARAEWAPSRRFFAVAQDTHAVDSDARPLVVGIGPFPDVSLRVRADAAPGGDGLSWPTAFATFGDAFETASRTGGVVNQVWVAAGTYNQPITVASPLSLLGGFAGVAETQASERDWAANPTILNPAGSGRAVDISAVANATIDGFTITAGLADSGAAVRTAAIETTIANCVIRNNTSTRTGGAGVHLLNPGSGTRLVNCLIDSNNARAAGRGAAVLIDQASSGVLIANCTITNNTADAPTVGAVAVTAGTPSIINSIISLNPAAGIVAAPGAAPLVSNCNLFGNTGVDAVGGFVPTAPIIGDPLFTSPSTSDYTLAPASPCLDRGATSQPPPEFNLDLAHLPRRVDADANGSTIPDAGAFERPCSPPACTGDLTGDSLINTADLVVFLGAFGRPPPPPPAVNAADLNNDGTVNTADLVIFLARFGATCPTCP